MNFTLERQGATLARLTGTQPDMPWFEAAFEPTPAFEPFRSLFDQWAALLDRPDLDLLEWERIAEQVRSLGVRIVSDDGRTIDEFALYVRGNRCRFRYG